jgi:hypothetical protein
MDITPTDPLPIGNWLGHIVSLFAIGGSLFGLIPALAALLAVIWYALEIYENRTVQRWVRARKLRKLVRLRARAVALELSIRNEDGPHLHELDDANRVHTAASQAAARVVHEAVKSNPPGSP